MNEGRSLWAWGLEAREPSQADFEVAARTLSARYGVSLKAATAPDCSAISLRKPRARPPAALASFCSTSDRDRVLHSYGHSFPDRVRKFMGMFDNPSDVVAYPRTEPEVSAVLDWASGANAVVIPFGGGSSVVGGVTPPAGGERVITLDTTALSRVLDVDVTSRAARVQAGALGPGIESQLKPHGLTLRHFPQSFEFSTLGGWIATRSAGHYATNQTHIEDFVESLRMVAPAGLWESRRLPGSGAGPNPDRFVAGSEGILGIITEAWMRVQGIPKYRESASITFPSFAAASEAARTIVQAKLWPANCRVLDEGEAAAAAGMDGRRSLLVLGFESSDVPQDGFMVEAISMARAAGGEISDGAIGPTGTEHNSNARLGPAAIWRKSFIEMPYSWNAMLGLGLINDTFETAVTWDRWPGFHEHVRSAVLHALKRVCGGGTVTCRFTHVYPDGPAPYFTFVGLGRRGSELEMWAEIQAAASDAVVTAGGTITHHHAVGRDHRPGYDAERPPLFASALRAAKQVLDPRSVLNPGVLID